MFIQIVSMKRIAVTLFVAAMMSSAAMGESFELPPCCAPGSDVVAMTWTSPGAGTITISGNAWVTGGSPGGSDGIKVIYVSSGNAAYITAPAGPPGIPGTDLLGGTVLPNNPPYPFPNAPPPPYGDINWDVPSAPQYGVAKGDVIVLELANQYTLSGITVNAGMDVGFAGN